MGSNLTGLEVALLGVLAATFCGAVVGIIRWTVQRHISRIDAVEARLPEFVTEEDMNLKLSELGNQIAALRAEGVAGDKQILAALGDFRGELNREVGALRGEIGAAHRRMDNLFRAPPSVHV